MKMTLGGFRAPGISPDLRVILTMALEGGDEDLVFDVSAVEGATKVRELNWPTSIDGRAVDYTVLSNDSGELLPRDWPYPYHPIHRATTTTASSRDI